MRWGLLPLCLSILWFASVNALDFTYEPVPAETGEVIHFTGFADGNVSEWRWSFGDGDVAYGRSVSHVYKNFGNYTVYLFVKYTNGSEEYCSKVVRVVRSVNTREITIYVYDAKTKKPIQNAKVVIDYNIETHTDANGTVRIVLYDAGHSFSASADGYYNTETFEITNANNTLVKIPMVRNQSTTLGGIVVILSVIIAVVLRKKIRNI